MKKSLAILLASAALTTVIGLPALAAFNAADGLDGLTNKIGFAQKHIEAATLHVADSDDDYSEHGYAAHGDDDDDHYGREDDDCDDDEGNRYGSDDDAAMTCDTGNNPAQAGTTGPPQNGLFANGTSPSVQVN